MFTKFKIVIIALIVLLYSSSSFSQTQERVVIKTMVGKVEIRSPKSGQWRPARVGMPVRMKWDIRTYVESSAELKFENGTILKVSENSVIGLSKILQDKSKGISKSDVKVTTGKVWGNVKKLVNKNSSFNFETPTAVAAIRGTILGIDVSSGKTTVDVVEGRVAVRNRGSNKTVLIETGKRAIVRRGQDNIETMNTTAADPFVVDTVVIDSLKKDSVIIDTTISDSLKSDSLIVDSLINDSLIETDSSSIDTAISDTTSATEDIELELSIDEPVKGDTVDDATILVKGTVSENANVIVNNIPVTVTSGKYSISIALTEGDNAIEVFAELNGEQKREVTLIIYNPITQEAEVSINKPSDGDSLTEPVVQVEGIVTEGSELMINGSPVPLSGNRFSASVSLLPGVNNIEVVAKLGSSTASEIIKVYFDPPKDLFLSVVVPRETKNTEIIINGATTPGAEVTIDGNIIVVLPDGSFSYKYLIPDEEGDYSYEIISTYRGKEMTETGTIRYTPEYIVAKLTISEVALKGNKIVIAGTTSPNAEIEINSITTKAAPDGRFRHEITLTELDIGEYVVDIVSIDDRTGEEQSASRIINVLSSNNAINTSAPTLRLVSQITKATKRSDLTFVATDLTPKDILTLTINNDDNEVSSGENLTYSLSDGENSINAIVKDNAGNVSNAISEIIYYLPGPLVIEINEPDESMFNIDDLPPMPKNTGALKMDVEIEIDDGIGTSKSESQILYVKLNGNLLQSKGNFRYTGNIAVNRGTNNFTVTAEDAAGNTAVKQFTVTISE